MARSYLSQPTIVRLPVLIEQIAAGEYRIPTFHRPFVWQDDDRLFLLDSIQRGLPIGSMIVWTTAEHILEEYGQLGPFRLPTPETASARNYVLDGHQRMATIYGAFTDPDAGAATLGGHDDARWPIYYDLESESFCLTRQRRASADWLPLPRLLKPDGLYEFQRSLLAKGLKQLSARAEALATRFKDYYVPIIPLFTEDIGLATECFRRANEPRAAMSEVDMLSAIVWSKKIDLRARFQELRDDLATAGWGDIDEQVLVDVLKVSAGLEYRHATPSILHEKLMADPQLLAQLGDHLHHAIDHLADRCGVFGPTALPYQVQLVLLCVAARWLGGPLEGRVGDDLEQWFWRTAFSEAFTGISDRDVWMALDQVATIVRGDPVDKLVALVTEKAIPPIAPFERFRANAVRSRTFALLLAQRGPLDTAGAPLGAPRMLADLGADAVPKIIPATTLKHGGDGPENRWVVHPRELKAMRDLLGRNPNSDRDAILVSHVISKEASGRYARGDLHGFLEVRRRDIIAMEREHVESLGLTYAERDDALIEG